MAQLVAWHSYTRQPQADQARALRIGSTPDVHSVRPYLRWHSHRQRALDGLPNHAHMAADTPAPQLQGGPGGKDTAETLRGGIQEVPKLDLEVPPRGLVSLNPELRVCLPANAELVPLIDQKNQ